MHKSWPWTQRKCTRIPRNGKSNDNIVAYKYGVIQVEAVDFFIFIFSVGTLRSLASYSALHATSSLGSQTQTTPVQLTLAIFTASLWWVLYNFCRSRQLISYRCLLQFGTIRRLDNVLLLRIPLICGLSKLPCRCTKFICYCAPCVSYCTRD